MWAKVRRKSSARTWNRRIARGFHRSDRPLRDGADEAPVAVINNRIVGGNHTLSDLPTVGRYTWSLMVDGRRIESDGRWRFEDLAVRERYVVSDEAERPLAEVENSYRFDGGELMRFRYALTPRDGAVVNWFGGVQVYAAPGTPTFLVLADTGRVMSLPPDEPETLIPAADRPDRTFHIELREDGQAAGSVVRIEYDRLASPQKHVAMVSRAGKIYPRAFDGEAAGSAPEIGTPLVVSGRFGTLPID